MNYLYKLIDNLFTKKKDKSEEKIERLIDCKSITVLDLYDVNVLTLDKFWSILESESDNVNQIMNKIKDVMKNIKDEMNFESYIVPNPKAENGGYWSDYPYDFVRETYSDRGIGQYLMFIIYVDGNRIDIKRNIIIAQPNLTKNEKKVVCGIFKKHLPYNFIWSGENIENMTITYQTNTDEFEIPEFYDDDTHPYLFLTIMQNCDDFIYENSELMRNIVQYLDNNHIKYHYSCTTNTCEFEIYRLNDYDKKVDDINKILDSLIKDNNEISSYKYYIFSDPNTEVYGKSG
jgi:hypothetical protein